MDAGMMGNGARSGIAAPARTTSAHTTGWMLRSGTAADIEAVAELRATVMRADLARLGRYDEHRVRQRLRDSFSTQHTSIIMVDRELAGCVTVRPAEGSRTSEGMQWLEHFYLAPHWQGRGLGSAVLRTVLERTDAQGVSVGLNVLQGSTARRLYERHGFVVEAEDPVDVFMVRTFRPVAEAAMSFPGPMSLTIDIDTTGGTRGSATESPELQCLE
ncbi:GNAT family N-acetyltransferase [Streptomyces milbemycinicus]|uniref:GNAT family N-acetyltransferase n=1 Tax=Streptomyces milbemycinicus TaxID=476552 RepID=UPI003411B891